LSDAKLCWLRSFGEVFPQTALQDHDRKLVSAAEMPVHKTDA
jgi:hypothetical protein